MDRTILLELEQALGKVVLGKTRELRLLLVALIADGHVLIEDLPGTGKTTLARALAQAIGAEFRRVQFTPDLLPNDVTGGAVWKPAQGEFEICHGPVFTQVLLADEINRSSPRTQSALLEAMEERQVTLEGRSLPLPTPFLVLATQNPVEFHGVYPLPEAQLDRFLLHLELGYPDLDTERRILESHRKGRPLDHLAAVCTVQDVLRWRAAALETHLDPAIADYILALVRATRERVDLRIGASPRSGILLERACRALAFLEGRDHVLPDDVQHLLLPVLGHRIHAREGDDRDRSRRILEEIRRGVPLPR